MRVSFAPNQDTIIVQWATAVRAEHRLDPKLNNRAVTFQQMVEEHKQFGETLTQDVGWEYWTSLRVDNPREYIPVEPICYFGRTLTSNPWELPFNSTGNTTKTWPSDSDFMDIGFEQITEVTHKCLLSPLLPEKRYYYAVGDMVSGVYSPIKTFVTEPSLCQGAAAPIFPEQRSANLCPQVEDLSFDEIVDHTVLHTTAAENARRTGVRGLPQWHSGVAYAGNRGYTDTMPHQ